MMKDIISIIIPCYNVGNLIKRCLDSVFGQSVRTVSYEVICIDDKSEDNTLEELLSYESIYPENMLVIPLEENGKQGYARNVALDYASGDFIMYVDADDVIADGILETLYQAIIEYQCDVAECAYKSFTDEPDMVVETQGKVEIYDMGEAAWRKTCILRHFNKTAPWGRLYKKELLEHENVFFLEKTTMEDTYFTELCMSYMHRYVHIPETYYFYYINTNGTYHSARALTYYMDSMRVQNLATDRIFGEGLLADCDQEWEYLHFLKAFCDPIARMLKNREFFSYENYVWAYSELHARYPAAAENIYVKSSAAATVAFAREIAKKMYSEQGLAMLMYGEGYANSDMDLRNQ